MVSLANYLKYRWSMVWKHRKPRWGNKNTPIIYHAMVPIFTTYDTIRTGWKKPRPDYGSVIETTLEYEDKGGLGYGKAVEVFERMLEGFAWKVVCDPFAGSGATILACENTSRRCVAIELQPSVAAVCLQRCEDSGLRPVLELAKTAQSDHPTQFPSQSGEPNSAYRKTRIRPLRTSGA